MWHVWSKIFVANVRARSPWNTGRKLHENIKQIFNRVWENVVRINLAEGRDRWRAFVSMVMNIGVP
jgi:hypothetical protein